MFVSILVFFCLFSAAAYKKDNVCFKIHKMLSGTHILQYMNTKRVVGGRGSRRKEVAAGANRHARIYRYLY